MPDAGPRPTDEQYASRAAYQALLTLTRDLAPDVRTEVLRSLRDRLRAAYAAGSCVPAWLR